MGSRLNISYRVQVGNSLGSQPPAAPSKIPVVWLVSGVLKAGEVQASSGNVFCTAAERFGYEIMKCGQSRLEFAFSQLLSPKQLHHLEHLLFPGKPNISCHLPWSWWDREPFLGWVQCAYTGRHHPHGERQQDLVRQDRLSTAFCFAAPAVGMVI